MDPLPSFTLFPDPLREKSIEASSQACAICGRSRGAIYSGPQYGHSKGRVTLCPWCIADGSAAARGVSFNDATICPCFDSTPQKSAADRDLVERRTPGFTTWQGNHWLMCCGRACVYLGEADAADLSGRWAAAIPSMFEGENRPQEERDEIVAGIRRGGSPCAYVFQCRLCNSLRAYWDCD